MPNYLELLDFYDLTNKEKLGDKINKLTKKKLVNIVEDVNESIDYTHPSLKNLGLFDIIASHSLSAQHGMGCSNLDCRQIKLERLGVFSTLYADKVYVPNFFRVLYHNKNMPLDRLKQEFYNDIFIINNIRPILEKGYLEFFDIWLCEECFSRKLENIKYYYDHIDELENHYIKQTRCSVIVGNNISLFTLNTSEDIVEHGITHFMRTDKKFKNTAELTQEQIKESGILKELINKRIFQLEYCQIVTKMFEVSFLTDNNLDNKLLKNRSSFKDNIINDAIKTLFFDTPIFDNISPKKIIQVRENEGYAFELYRNSLKKYLLKIVGNKEIITPEYIRESYDDTIKPEVLKLENTIKNNRSSVLKKLLANVTIMGLTLGIGIKTGFIDSEVIKAIGAFTTAGQLGSTLVEALQKGPDIRNNDFYFLWKINADRTNQLNK